MIYLYKCDNCNKEVEIEKSMSEASKIEKCFSCKKQLVRVFISSAIKTSDGYKKSI